MTTDQVFLHENLHEISNQIAWKELTLSHYGGNTTRVTTSASQYDASEIVNYRPTFSQSLKLLMACSGVN